MNASRLTNLLAEHADGLVNPAARIGSPASSAVEMADIAPLLRIAERLYESMKPVEPRAVFVRNLRTDLMENDRRRLVVAKRVKRGLTIGAAVLGSAVSIASVVGAIILVTTKKHARTHARAAHAPST